MFGNIIRILGGDPNKRELEQFSEIVNQINQLEPELEALSDDALRAKTDEFRAHLQAATQGTENETERRQAEKEALDEILPYAFATVREASKRTIGLRHYDVQLIGGITLHRGKIAEMRTGEGKTLVATLPLYLNALTGRGVHLITVNDYLARRDARWMGPIYHKLGLSVGVLQMAARTDGGRLAFLVDLENTSIHEDQHQLSLVSRKEAYQADITYGTNSEFGFDYLRDNLAMSLEERVQRGHYYAIIDEVDNILIDEARTPLIISGPAADESQWYVQMAQVIRQLTPEDYEINERDRNVALTEIGEAHVEQILQMPLRDPERPEDITPEQARILGFLEQALRAQFLFRRNKDYLVQNGKVVIVDEFTGRLMPGRRWSEGLHQAVEAKEGVKVEPENITYATITLQNYFRMHEKLAGMTGTAETEAEELHKIYKLDVLPIPTNLEYLAQRSDSLLVEQDGRDEKGYRYFYYTRSNDPDRQPVFWRRKDYTDIVYRSEEAKLRAITQEILRYHVLGRPLLVGTASVEHSERLSARLQAEPIRRLTQTLLIRRAWMEKNNVDFIERVVPELEPLNRPLHELDTGQLRQLGRSYGISLNPEEPANLERLLGILELQTEDQPRLLKVLQGGISHQVLNARRHDEESQIIARAGAFAAVTIATNMAGRGVDIKLGGELPENILSDANRVLERAGLEPFHMTNEERRQALLEIPAEQYGIYEESVAAFLQYVEDMERVRRLGGLHVIGTERHEARRIDNQLRGRAARQGDPGSSRFYLSLEDELMRLFGGQQVEGLWKRIMIDDSQPIEMNLLGRLVEQSQQRVEGANFDVRKHLLEYDDVLNSQRKRIYEQRDRVFTKEDLSEDVLEMLRSELQGRIPQALKDEEGPWRLLAYLDEIQPAFHYDTIGFPSFAQRLLTDEIWAQLPKENPTVAEVRQALLKIAEQALEAEITHLMNSVRVLFDRAFEAMESQRLERHDALDTFFEGLGEEEEDEETPKRRPQELLTELSELTRVPLKLSPDELRRLASADHETLEALKTQIDGHLLAMHLGRLIGALERRLEESLGLKPGQLQGRNWQDFANQILDIVEALLNQRVERLLGSQGQIARDLDAVFDRLKDYSLDDALLSQMLIVMSQGSRIAFDPRTHRKITRRYNRLNYSFLAARLLQNLPADTVTERILNHLEDALAVLQQARGKAEWDRLVQSEASLGQLDERLQNQLAAALTPQRYEALAAQPLPAFSDSDRLAVCEILGRHLQNETCRELLLRSISEQWVDYLTRVEALRVSIGLEAYAQRDPLVQYKGRATEMFQSLMADIRMSVISRIFTYNARRAAAVAVDREPQPESAAQPAAEDAVAGDEGQRKKKKRHRRR